MLSSTDTRKRLIETDAFPFVFLSELAKQESWRKEVYRPIYYVHKWWAKRLGSIFRGILLGCKLSEEDDLCKQFYETHSYTDTRIFDPFMGSGVTIGEAHKLGFTSLGRDINPVAAELVRVALGPMESAKLKEAFAYLSNSVGDKLRCFYRSTDSQGRPCDVLYYFWVIQALCPHCTKNTDLFSSWVVSRNAYPKKKPEIQILCPSCGDIFPGLYTQDVATCRSCEEIFRPWEGPAKRSTASCQHCDKQFRIIDAVSDGGHRPEFRLYGKLVLTQEGNKEYLPSSPEDQMAYDDCSRELNEKIRRGTIRLPDLTLEPGHNTQQAINYGFNSWQDFFNDRQLLVLSYLQSAIAEISDESTRDILLLLFSGILEFNNMFASYKGEGTGAVRHMFSNHILKPERMPIEANVWGTPKSSGSFSNLFKSRILRAIKYRSAPTEVGKGRPVASQSFTGKVEPVWPVDGDFSPHAIYLSCGDSAKTQLPNKVVDLIVTDPPFFNNVHYSELADFFYSWQKLVPRGFIEDTSTTRTLAEVQDADPDAFSTKLQGVFSECERILKDDGILVFTYHHSHEEGWQALSRAVLEAGFIFVNSHPVKSEMSVAIPKSQASEPIQLDIIFVCRKKHFNRDSNQYPSNMALNIAREKICKLRQAGFTLSQNDEKVVLFGQLLTTMKSSSDAEDIAKLVDKELERL